MWKEFMAHNETNNSFHDNQYGGRKGRQPQSAILNKSSAMWKARCDLIHGKSEGKTKSARRRELIDQIKTELTRTANHADHTTRQLRKNIEKSMGNAKTDALEVWLDMLRNVKGETFFRKKIDNIRRTGAQPITNFFRRVTGT